MTKTIASVLDQMMAELQAASLHDTLSNAKAAAIISRMEDLLAEARELNIEDSAVFVYYPQMMHKGYVKYTDESMKVVYGRHSCPGLSFEVHFHEPPAGKPKDRLLAVVKACGADDLRYIEGVKEVFSTFE